jgi:hypothetical protein
LNRDFHFSEELDERLREWGAYFKDRRKYSPIGSAEKKFQPHSEDYAKEGWGDPVPPQPQIRQRDWVLRAIKTNEAIMQLEPVHKWSITYAFAYPGLPRFIVLRVIKKFTGRRLTWNQYLDAVDIARMRVWTLLR